MLQLTPTIVMSQVSKNSCKSNVTALLHTDVLCSTISRTRINPVQHCTHPFSQLFQGTVVDRHSCLLGLRKLAITATAGMFETAEVTCCLSCGLDTLHSMTACTC